MTTNDNLVEVLNDLIEINNDRSLGYENAAKEVKDDGQALRPIFESMAHQSQKFKTELTAEVGRLGGELNDDSSALGKLHRMWMDLRTAFSSKDGKTTLETCEFGEDSALKAYDEALASDAEIDANTRQIITSQREEIKKAHDKIKSLRDAAKAVN